LEPAGGGSQPVLSLAGHGAIPVHPNWRGSAFTTVPFGSTAPDGCRCCRVL
jgi:hypothetical protein